MTAEKATVEFSSGSARIKARVTMAQTALMGVPVYLLTCSATTQARTQTAR